MKNLGPVSVMLGIQIKQDRANHKIFVFPSEYSKEILNRFRMPDSKHVATPIDRSCSELSEQESIPGDDVPYRQAIGSLMDLMVGSRPFSPSLLQAFPAI